MQRLFRHVRRRPHFFNVVESTDFRTEDVNDDVAGIDQHPVSGLETFDAGVSEPFILHVLEKMLANRRNMPVRPPGDHDHVVRKRRFSGNVERDDIFSLGVLEAREDGFEGMAGGIGATVLALRDSNKCSSLGVYCCQRFSFPRMTKQVLATRFSASHNKGGIKALTFQDMEPSTPGTYIICDRSRHLRPLRNAVELSVERGP